ncbi:hypothetical protein ACFYRN_40010 [Streptomyces sp. NPDC005227]|uniref:hypothetical protein n=1 Tax=Streptomyces sp. NPDC005227 TaxID=3364707 RepID=UPI0036C0F089
MTRASRPQGRTTVRNWKPTAALLAASALLTLSACSSNKGSADNAKPSPPASSTAPSASASPSRSSSLSADQAAVLAVYTHYREEQAKAYAKASVSGTDIEKYATTEALGKVTRDVLSLRTAGNAASGAPVSHNTEIAALKTDGPIPKATIKDCLDVTNWGVVNKKTGKALPTPKGQLKKHVNDVTLEKWGNRWLVRTDTAKPIACGDASASPSAS